MIRYASVLVLLMLYTFYSVAQEKSISFDDKYIRANSDKVSIEINEVQELTYIMMAISKYGLKDSNMVNHNSTYYQEVISHFHPYREHQVIHAIDSLLNQSLIYYILISSNAYGFTFEGDDLKKTNVYTFPAKGVGALAITEDPVLILLNSIEDFARKSGFRKFYKSKKAYFEKIEDDYIKYGEIDKQKKWLERKFDDKINSYRILTSALIGGINATSTFEDNSFKEMLLFLPVITNKDAWSEAYNTAMNSRVIFTEIDHNYVGPLSAKHKRKIDTIFDNRAFWVNPANKSTDYYPNPIKVFDEYLTWGLFILYSQDQYPGDTNLQQEIIQHIDTKMQAKGFPKSREFNKELIRLYQLNPDAKISAIYDDLLRWASIQK